MSYNNPLLLFYRLSFIGRGVIFSFFLSLLNCCYPNLTHRDLLEMERVWQYLKAYCLWQERVPADPMQYVSPQELAASINDTLYDTSRYTYYLAPGRFDATSIFGKPFAYQSSLDASPFASSTIVFDSNWSPTAAYLQISLFDSTTLAALLAIRSDKPDLVVDLRKNAGGNIDICTAAVELFLPAGRPFIRTTYRKNVWLEGDTGLVSDRILTTRRDNDRWEGKRIAVWIDGGCASAAEIFVAALRDGLDSSRVKLIGKRTYGKGIGQYVRLLDSGAALSITAFRFYRISGDDYHLRGIEPDMPTDVPDATTRLYFRGILAKNSTQVLKTTESDQKSLTPLGYSFLAGAECLLRQVIEH